MNALALFISEYCHLLFFPNFRSRILCNSSAFSGRNSAGPKNNPLMFANFKELIHHVLDTPSIERISVQASEDCLFRYVNNGGCFSANVAAFPRSDGNVSCDLLPTDKYTASDKLKANHTFHHYSIMVSRTYFCRQ